MKKSFVLAISFFMVVISANAQRYAVIDSKYILEKIRNIKMRRFSLTISVFYGSRKLTKSRQRLTRCLKIMMRNR